MSRAEGLLGFQQLACRLFQKITLDGGKLALGLGMGKVMLGQHIGELTEQCRQFGHELVEFMTKPGLR